MNEKNENAGFSRKSGYAGSEGENTRDNYVYILLCRDESLYTGWTTDINKRLAAHNAGRGAKYTRSRRPVQLVYLEKFSTKEEAMKREAAIKRLTAAKKRELIAAGEEKEKR